MKRDQDIFDLIEREHQRQLKGMELIASENFVNDGYGPVTKFKITATSSGVSDVNAAQTVKARKVIENGQVYIIAGDKKYNVMGAEVK